MGARSPAKSGEVALEIDEPTRTPGMAETWFEIIAAVGIPAMPISAVTNLLCSWIWSGFQRTRSHNTKARITVRTEEKEVKVEIWETDASTLQKILETVLADVHTSS